MTRFGTMYEAGDVVIVPFPFTDLSAVKQRPVLVLSSKRYNAASQDIVTCGITSNPHEKDHTILLPKDGLLVGMIPIDSKIKSDKLFTIHQGMIKKTLGKVKRPILEETYRELLSILER